MDPNLRRDVDAFLADLWDGTDVELALTKADLVIARKPVAGWTEDDTDQAINHVVRMLLDAADAESVVVGTSLNGPRYKAIGIDELNDLWESLGEDE